MDITVTKQENMDIVALKGNFDISASDLFDAQMTSLIDGGSDRIILDLADVPFIASTGLRMVLKTAQSIKEKNGILRVCGVNSTVMEVFKMTGFDTILTILDTREDALEAMT